MTLTEREQSRAFGTATELRVVLFAHVGRDLSGLPYINRRDGALVYFFKTTKATLVALGLQQLLLLLLQLPSTLDVWYFEVRRSEKLGMEPAPSPGDCLFSQAWPDMPMAHAIDLAVVVATELLHLP